MDNSQITTELALANAGLSLYVREPLDTPGIVPAHLKKSVLARTPLIEVLQRLLYRLRPENDLEKVLAIVAVYQACRPVYNYLKHLLFNLCTSEIIVAETDPLANEILAWMAENVMNSSLATKGVVSGAGTVPYGSTTANNTRTQGFNSLNADTEIGIHFTPPIGQKLFWIGFRPFLLVRGQSGAETRSGNGPLRRNESEGGGSKGPSQILVITPGWDLRPLQKFVYRCREYKRENKGETTTIYFSAGSAFVSPSGTWQPIVKSIRKMDTVDMDEDIKAALIKDAEYYYSQDSKRFYANCGIPYRRGYLFYGPPGTGKTSFSMGLAGHLNCDIYMINLAAGGMTDTKLHQLFHTLPKKCVVVVEDVDSAGISRDAPEPPVLKPGPASKLAAAGYVRRGDRTSTVTLSGLLNAIDGNAAQEGRLLIMTSNSPDALDPAMKRPGRIDKMSYFGYLKADSARRIFLRLIGRAALASGDWTSEQLEEKAVEFSKRLPEDTFTPAEVQNFLQFCRGNPVQALDELDAWIKETLEAREQRQMDAAREKEAQEAKAREEKAQAEKAQEDETPPTKPLVNGIKKKKNAEEKVQEDETPATKPLVNGIKKSNNHTAQQDPHAFEQPTAAPVLTNGFSAH